MVALQQLDFSVHTLSLFLQHPNPLRQNFVLIFKLRIDLTGMVEMPGSQNADAQKQNTAQGKIDAFQSMAA